MVSSQSSLHGSTLGLIFTDARGRVVFLDNQVLSLLGQLEVGRLVGEPLHKIIHVAADAISGLLSEVARSGYVHERPLLITRGDGTQIETVCTGIASYDDQHVFIGADLTLRDPTAAAPPALATHGDILGVRIQQIEAAADAQIAEDMLLAQLYVTAMIGAVQVLLARMGGQRVADALEGVVNELAGKQGWPVRLVAGQFVIDSDHLPQDAYRALIDAMIGYAQNVTGSRLLFQEMFALDTQMTAAARDNAARFNMRFWLE